MIITNLREVFKSKTGFGAVSSLDPLDLSLFHPGKCWQDVVKICQQCPSMHTVVQRQCILHPNIFYCGLRDNCLLI